VQEWSHGSTDAGDERGDDDVEIIIQPDGTITVQYDSVE
jgi:hypothetical protein